jgi:hypothetical protein
MARERDRERKRYRGGATIIGTFQVIRGWVGSVVEIVRVARRTRTGRQRAEAAVPSRVWEEGRMENGSITHAGGPFPAFAARRQALSDTVGG